MFIPWCLNARVFRADSSHTSVVIVLPVPLYEQDIVPLCSWRYPRLYMVCETHCFCRPPTKDLRPDHYTLELAVVCTYERCLCPLPTGVERRSSPKPKVERLPLPRTASIECSLHSFNGMADEVGRIQRRIQRDRDCRDLRRCSPSKVEGMKREPEVPSAWSQASSYSHLTLNS